MMSILRTKWLWAALVAVLLIVGLAITAAFTLRSRTTTATAATGQLAETRTNTVPTWTPTPGQGQGASLIAALPTATPAVAGEEPAATLVPTVAPVSPAAASTDPAPASPPENTTAITAENTGENTGENTTVSIGDPAGVSAAAAASTTSNPAPEGTLAMGRTLHRYGDYANARAQFARLVDDPTVAADLRRAAQYDLARSYLGEGLYGEAVATLDQLDQNLAADGADPNQFGQKEQFLRAEALLGGGQYGDAIAAYWRFLDAYPWMGESVQPRIAAAYLALNDPAAAAEALRRAADLISDNPGKAHMLEQVAQAHADAGQYAAAVAAYDEILGFAENAAYRAELQYQAGQALSTAGDGPGAIARWRAATEESAESKSAYLALVELINRNADFDLYQRGYIDLFAEAYEPAISAFQAYLDATDASDARRGSALHRLGQSYLGAGNYAEAIARLDQVINEYPDCDCFGLAWLHKALAQAAAGDSAAARRTYRTFARQYPDDPQAPEALWLSGRQALDEGNQVEAAVDFLALADSFPASERAPQALYALGIGAFSKQLYGQAGQVFTRLQQGYPDYRWDAVPYWLGRSQAAAGDTSAAQATWQALIDRAPDIYYGVLAAYGAKNIPVTGAAQLAAIDEVAGPAARLEGDDGSQAFAEQWLATWITTTAQADLATLPTAIAEDQNLAKGRLLLDLDQRGDALAALERVYDAHSDDPHALYALSLEFARLGAYRLSILAASRLLILSGVPLVEDGPVFIQRLAYPRAFDELIVREARANNIDPRVYFSLIRQESLFEEGARSTAAAQGLAQIVPDTGQWIAEQLGHPEYTNDIIYRPAINLRFGAYYLAWVRDYLGGNLVSALAGYNAGPGNAKTWREASGEDDALFAELLTFSEPRLYLQQILGNLYHYARLYGEQVQ